MNKSKKKIKNPDIKLPKPIKIKKEKTEEERTLHPMSYYIDDRLELVKQVFGTLKPKTITNLAPDFLKKKSLDEIEALCLEELICISTKRLRSIINGTKCPSDTESSNDSDVEHNPDHVSLEEISSDSEIEDSKRTVKNKLNGGITNNKKNLKNDAEKDNDGGPISVLELLELQARARAIRSQLALEPVTKIEVDSDEESAPSSSNKSSNEMRKSRKERKRKSSIVVNESDGKLTPSAKQNKTNGTTDLRTTSNTINATVTQKEKALPLPSQPVKKIKLKRNYRKPSLQANENETNANTNNNKDIEIKREELKRPHSQSPDVIPIVAEPETLLISDSSDIEDAVAKAVDKSTNNENGNKTNQKIQAEPKKRTVTETEEGELSESSDEKTNDESKLDDQKTDGTIKTPNGTINEKDVVDSNQVEMGNETVKETTNEPLQEEEEEEEESVASADVNIAIEIAGVKENEVTNDDNNSADKSAVLSTAEQPASNESTKISDTAVNLEEYDDQNDDVISIEGGDLEAEIIEHLEENEKLKTSTFGSNAKETEKQNSQQDCEDVISLDSTEDEIDDTNEESWHSRYLKSSKVSKVLAASRLGKRVRDKIKISKHRDITRDNTTDNKDEKSNATIFISKHEDGSVEQYKELLEMRQRKI